MSIRHISSHILIASGGVTVYSLNIMIFAKHDTEARMAAARAAMCLHPQYFTFSLYRCMDGEDVYLGHIKVDQPEPTARFIGDN